MAVFRGRDVLRLILLIAVLGLVGTAAATVRTEFGRPWAPAVRRDGTAAPAVGAAAGRPASAPEAGGPALGSAAAAQAAPPMQDPFVELRLDRERTRAQQLDLLRELMNNPRADGAARQEAGRRWLRITEDMGREAEVEGLLRAKGYADAIVFIHDRSATVVVKIDALGQADVVRIADVIMKATGLKPEAVSIMAKGR